MNKETEAAVNNFIQHALKVQEISIQDSFTDLLILGRSKVRVGGGNKNRVKMLRTIKEYSKNFLLALLYWAIIWFVALLIMYYQTYHT